MPDQDARGRPISRTVERRVGTREVSLLIVWPVAFAFVTVASFAIGYVMHLIIEKPAMRMRQWLAA